MPKSNRGGRRTTVSFFTRAVPPTPPSNQNPPPQNQPLNRQTAGNFTPVPIDPNAPFHNLTMNEAYSIRAANIANYTPTVEAARKMYIADDSNTNLSKYGLKYSSSQLMNHALENGEKLNANGKYMDKYLNKGMHPLGTNAILQRGAHASVIESLGIKNFDSLLSEMIDFAGNVANDMGDMTGL